MAKIVAVAASAAVGLFPSARVQTATKVKVEGKDGVTREKFETKLEALRAEHVLSAKQSGKRVTVVTIDGQKLEAESRKQLPDADVEAEDKK